MSREYVLNYRRDHDHAALYNPFHRMVCENERDAASRARKLRARGMIVWVGFYKEGMKKDEYLDTTQHKVVRIARTALNSKGGNL